MGAKNTKIEVKWPDNLKKLNTGNLNCPVKIPRIAFQQSFEFHLQKEG